MRPWSQPTERSFKWTGNAVEDLARAEVELRGEVKAR